MIPYELIIPSASRPHLLAPVLASYLERLDRLPTRGIVHDDAVFSGRAADVRRVVAEACSGSGVPYLIECDDPPIKHGPALHWLLGQVETEYVLYGQDDHRVVRPIPVTWALQVLDENDLNQIRFNKRDTMDKKGREGQEFYKVEKVFAAHNPDPAVDAADPYREYVQELCVADHWYFQTGVWRVDAIKPIVDWWMGPGQVHGAFDEHMEVKVNQVMNGQWNHVLAGSGYLMDPTVPLLSDSSQWNNPRVRAQVHKTFIWGKVGEPAFVQHIGDKPEDWALVRGNRDLRR